MAIHVMTPAQCLVKTMKTKPMTIANPAAARIIGQDIFMSLSHSSKSSKLTWEERPSILLSRKSVEGKHILPNTTLEIINLKKNSFLTSSCIVNKN